PLVICGIRTSVVIARRLLGMSPPVAVKEVSLGPSKERPRKGRKKDRETSNEAKMPPKLFRFTHFPKNASATPLVSHTFKTKDLKPFRFTHLQKKGGGWLPLSNLQPHTSNLCSSLSPLDSALTPKRAAKSFRSNTYEKHTGGE